MEAVKNDDKCMRCGRPLGYWTGRPHEDSYMTWWETYHEHTLARVICEICYEVELLDSYKNTGLLTTKLSLTATLAHFHLCESDSNWRGASPPNHGLRSEIKEFYLQNCATLLKVHSEMEELRELVHKFELKHWLNGGIKDKWNKSSWRGHRAKDGDIEVLMWGCAGRVLMTLRLRDQELTMIFTDSKEQLTPNGGIQGITATKHDAISMLHSVIDNKLKFKRDDKVSVA